MNLSRIGRVLPGAALLCLLNACGSASKYENASQDIMAAADSTSSSYAYSPEKSKLPEGRMLVRKASMNFKVKELQKTSQRISEITNACGGEVWNSHLKTDIQNSFSKKISADSLLEVSTYRQTNELTLRVPSKNLDSLLNRLEQFSQLLHDKEITTENVSLEYLENELKAKNIARTQPTFEQNMEHKKSNILQYAEVERGNIDLQNEVVDKQIHNLALLDQVQYSTVHVYIYQDAQTTKAIVANIDADRFEPTFFASSTMAFQDGWEFMLGLFVFLIRIWPLYIFLVLLYSVIRFGEKFRVRMFAQK